MYRCLNCGIHSEDPESGANACSFAGQCGFRYGRWEQDDFQYESTADGPVGSAVTWVFAIVAVIIVVSIGWGVVSWIGENMGIAVAAVVVLVGGGFAAAVAYDTWSGMQTGKGPPT